MITPEMRRAMKRDLHMDSAQIPRYIDTERQSVRKQEDARRLFGNAYAGSWMERDSNGEFKLVVGATDVAFAAKAPTLGAEVRHVRHSLAQLETSMSQLNRRRASIAGRKEIYSWRVDLPSNTVVVTAAANATAAAIDFVAASGADPQTVRVETSTLRPQLAYNLIGGDRYTLPNGGWCSIGLPVTQGGFVTAGHCGTLNTAVTGSNGVAIGSFAGSTFPGSDLAWVRATNTNWISQPWVANYVGGVVSVIGGLEAPVGAVTCRSGARTGYRCGIIGARNVTVNYGGSLVYGLTQSSACLGQGDSGGSFITPGGEAQGVASGGALNANGENCSIASPVSFHQPLQPILNAYGLTLSTVASCGRLNPGNMLTAGNSILACNGRYRLYMGTTGRLTLYNPAGAVIWSRGVSALVGMPHRASMGRDGDLTVSVFNNPKIPQVRWSSGTGGHPGALLLVQGDGNMIIISHQGQLLWASNTAGL
ncbi:MAG: alpha-lytic protease prodomain-containing protein [Lysobacteraceae bacterium]